MSSFFEAFENLDRRIIYLLLVVVILIPLIKPMGLPIGMSPETQKMYDTVEALPKGAIVIVSPDFSPGAEPELWPAFLATTKHLFRKNVRVIGLSTWPEGVMYADRAIQAVAKNYPDKKYGVDYVVLPYKAGKQAAIAAMAKDFRGLYAEDFYGKSTKDMPLIQAVTQPSDVALLCSWLTGDDLIWYLQQWEAIYHVKVAGGATSVAVPNVMPYLASGQLSGLQAGLRGAAEYEKAIGELGPAAAGMDAQSLSHVLVIAFIALGNLAYFRSKKKGG
jgi:hypothetical protein